MLGMLLSTNAHAVNYQDKSSVLTVSAHHQKLNGTAPQKPAHAHQIPTVNNANHAQLQDNGTTKQTPVNAHHQPQYGTEINVFAQLEDMDQTVSNAQPQDTGTSIPTNVNAEAPSSGTVKTVSALNHISCIKEDVLNAQMDINGKTTNVKNATAPTKIWKFYKQEFESDRFINLFQKYFI